MSVSVSVYECECECVGERGSQVHVCIQAK